MDLRAQIQHKIDSKTKPLGALGLVETLAMQICLVQKTLEPTLIKPTIVVFAGDHGIAHEGVSAYPQEVTWQMVMNFVSGGAAINVFTKQHAMDLCVVDAGVNYDFPEGLGVVPKKIAKGTKSFLRQAAMSHDQLKQALDYGRELVSDLAEAGCNVLGFGEMGIANTTAATALICQLSGMSLESMTGRGTGLDDEQLNHKLKVLQSAFSHHGRIEEPERVLQTFGGFEIAQMVGAMLEAVQRDMVILVDGFIASAAYLVASKMDTRMARHAVFCHQSHEAGHQALLRDLNVEPLLKLDLRLGEGTGCALAFPLVESAVRFMNDMASFEQAGVSEAD
ncbi:nicotinate-nucleotide--dimethylbenzimidazole phosphoribosyltransferase [Oleiphilus sp. HI0071]|nr:nicotinate-nucleotide--dimethylbenzimidazole phosphoribosyltransferase [Oleiphilus sp. HI0065]KZY82964.1 nicotinate-nucleotide--dimethylbenzimidazole phosphoribosyltransferase [Oleiphilus sp. HI0071]KZZ01219.1 nicotinate-nucleotide--dimethylbenzimidazole phosphoribosyltransferase [Oleiphilus sp. HI0073]KZZ18059.1 nicotinate-nucleotide--dimethylbenzimidazole phosphoribosyltransferase [Oleiphilus sp. HI0080]KZZ48586.1 nicotinate-nucleotide--dimethylbenzimidazole phosphoribosyltransferase [Olei